MPDGSPIILVETQDSSRSAALIETPLGVAVDILCFEADTGQAFRFRGTLRRPLLKANAAIDSTTTLEASIAAPKLERTESVGPESIPQVRTEIVHPGRVSRNLGPESSQVQVTASTNMRTAESYNEDLKRRRKTAQDPNVLTELLGIVAVQATGLARIFHQ